VTQQTRIVARHPSVQNLHFLVFVGGHECHGLENIS
jgi:hypothetical protein